MKKFKYVFSLLFTLGFIFSSTIAANAASWSIAEELGFEVEQTNYDSYCWINERSSTAMYICIIVILQVLFIIRHVLVEKKLLISTNTVSLHK